MTLALAFLALLVVVLALLLWPHRRECTFALGVMAFVVLCAGGIYALAGSPRVAELADAHQQKIKGSLAAIAQERDAIRANPQNLEAWLKLSDALMDIGDYKQASEGFKQAVLVSKGHPRIIMAYAEALILQQGGVVSEQAKKSIDIALMLDETQPLARYYNAIWLLQEGRNEEAMQTMKNLYAELPDDSSLKRRMKAEIGR